MPIHFGKIKTVVLILFVGLLGVLAGKSLKVSEPPFHHRKIPAYSGPSYDSSAAQENIKSLIKRTQENKGVAGDFLKLAQAYLFQSEWEESNAKFEEIRTLAEKALPVGVPAKLLLARLAIDDNEPHRAIQLVSELPRHSEWEPEILSILALGYRQIGEPAKSIESIDELALKYPTIQSYSLRGYLLSSVGRIEEAEKVFRDGLGMETGDDPISSARGRVMLAQLYLSVGNLSDSQSLLNEALRIAPRLTGAYYQLARLESLRQNLETAAELTLYANGLAGNIKFLRSYARIRALQRQSVPSFQCFKYAEKTLREGLANRPNRNRLQLAQLLLERGHHRDVEEAVELAKAEVKFAPSPEALKVLASAFYESERWEEARSTVEALLRQGVREDWVYGILAKIDWQLEKIDSANFYLMQATSLNPALSFGKFGISQAEDSQIEKLLSRLSPFATSLLGGSEVSQKPGSNRLAFQGERF